MDGLREWKNRAEAAYRQAEAVLDREDLALRKAITSLREIRARRGRHSSTAAMPGERALPPRRVHRATLFYVI